MIYNVDQNLPLIPAKVNRSQEKRQRRLSLLNEKAAPAVPSARLIARPKYWISKLTASDRAIFMALLAYRIKHPKIVCPSQETLASIAGVTRETVSRALKKLERLGAIQRTYRHRRTCLYDVASIFWNKFVIKKLKKLLPVLLLLPIAGAFQNVTPQGIFNSLFRYKNSLFSLVSSYTNSGTERWENKRTPNEIFNLLTSGVINMNKKKEFFKKIEQELNLSDLGKAKLAVFPTETLEKAFVRMLRDMQKDPTLNAFGVLMRQCKDVSPEVDTSHNNPIFKELQRRLGFTLGDPPILRPSANISPKKGEYDQAALAKKAYRSSVPEESHEYQHPRPGEPLLFEHINEYTKRTTGRELYPGKTGPATKSSFEIVHGMKPVPPSPHRHLKESIHEICDRWGAAVKKQREKMRRINPALMPHVDVNLAARCMFREIAAHIDFQYKIGGLQHIVDYLNAILFSEGAPQSVKESIMISEAQYFGLLEQEYNKFAIKLSQEKSRNE